MKDKLVGFEIAKLAKEKGFNIETCDFFSEKIISNLVPQGDYKYLSINYDNIGEDISPHGFWNWNSTNESKRLITAFNESYEEDFKEVFSAPIQSLLQRWLREVHNIDIHIESYRKHSNKVYGQQVFYGEFIPTDTGFIRKTARKNSVFITYSIYEEALEEGLKSALELIK